VSHPDGGYSTSNPDGGDPPAPLDDISEMDRGLPRIGTPVHVVVFGNPSGAPCCPAVYLGYDGTEAWLLTLGPGGREMRAGYAAPGVDPTGPAFAYGTFHIAARCDITGRVQPAQLVGAHGDGPDFSTDSFWTETRRG
jgi:hypothetical protein